MSIAQQISQSTAPIVHRLGAIGLGILVVAVIAYLLAVVIGGTSRTRRKVVFYVVSIVGFAAVLFFIFSRP